jgi:hypothetical protein
MKITDFNLDGVNIKLISKKDQKKRDKAMEKFCEELLADSPEYHEKMRQMKMKSYQLSLTRVIG